MSFAPSTVLHGMSIDCTTTGALLDRVFAGLANGQGGWIVTANLDFLRRHARDADVRALYDAADVRVADGMPLVWAARLQGQPLPERIAGSSLVPALAARAAAEGRSVYLLGGAPGAAQRAAAQLMIDCPGLRLAGVWDGRVSDPPTDQELDAAVAALDGQGADLVLVGLGSPKQERLIAALRQRLPAAWMVGVGVSFSFMAGDLARAPGWMQRLGVEWIHRMAQEPRRLGKRYLIEDLPFAFELLAGALRARVGGPPP